MDPPPPWTSWKDWARRTPEAPAVHFEERVLTYGELDAAADRHAHWARQQGLKRGDVVVLLMENRPEFLCAWMGLAKLGIVVALINTNLRGHALTHTLRLANARAHVVGIELAEAHAEAARELEAVPPVWVTGGRYAEAADLDQALAAQPAAKIGADARADLKTRDLLFYIYTCGTTGLPKAARISHHRFLHGVRRLRCGRARRGRPIACTWCCRSTTRRAASAPSARRSTRARSIVLRRRFSASHFWEDCAATT